MIYYMFWLSLSKQNGLQANKLSYLKNQFQINKMKRYLSEKQVGQTLSHSTTIEVNHKKSVRDFRVSAEVPEEYTNSSKMLKLLKKVNVQSEMLKGRLSVLQLRQEKNELKARSNSQRYKLIRQVREQMEREQQKRDQHLKLLMQKMSETKQSAQLQRLGHKNNLQRIQNEVYKKNNSEYKKSKQKTIEINNRIILQRRSEEKIKKQRTKQIRQQQKIQKANVQQFLQNKKKGIKQVDNSDSIRFSRVAQQKKRQMEQLAALESQMIRKQARSKLSIQQSGEKLRHLISSKKSQRTTQTIKLPHLNPQNKKEISQQK